MDPTFLTILRGLDYDTLTMAQASEVMGALREAVEKGEAWYRKFSAGFVNGTSGTISPNATQGVVRAGPSRPTKPSAQGATRISTSAGRTAQVAPTPKRGRGRPRKVVPEVMRAGMEQGRLARPITSKSAGSTPAPATQDDHPPIGVLAGSYVSTTGPDPNHSYSLPPTHPRAAGVAPATTGDADFAAVEAGKVRFQ